jgi:hypothetical protein
MERVRCGPRDLRVLLSLDQRYVWFREYGGPDQLGEQWQARSVLGQRFDTTAKSLDLCLANEPTEDQR